MIIIIVVIVIVTAEICCRTKRTQRKFQFPSDSQNLLGSAASQNSPQKPPFRGRICDFGEAGAAEEPRERFGNPAPLSHPGLSRCSLPPAGTARGAEGRSSRREAEGEQRGRGGDHFWGEIGPFSPLIRGYTHRGTKKSDFPKAIPAPLPLLGSVSTSTPPQSSPEGHLPGGTKKSLSQSDSRESVPKIPRPRSPGTAARPRLGSFADFCRV